MKSRMLVLTAVLLLTPALMFAGSTCGTATVVPADGRVVDFDFVSGTTGSTNTPPGTNWYEFSGSAGHSYSVEVRQDYDDINTDLTVSVLSGACPGSAVTVNSTVTSEPALPANSFRGSFTAGASGTFVVSVANSNASTGRYISVSVSDTTQYNVRWSTYGTFITQWGFQNTTGQPITATLVAFPTLPAAASHTITFTVPANTQLFKIIGASASDDINEGVNEAGFAVLTHNGPPGGLLTDAFFINSAATVIVPSVFQPVRQGHSSGH
jgi:hypothetical protein